MTKVIAISGGIGSGKSVVSDVLRAMGFSVYDCDSRAKYLMDNSASIKSEIANKIDTNAIVDGNINRKRLAEIVFSNPEKLHSLNAIVHSAIRTDIKTWITRSKQSFLFIETAILYQSGLDKMVDEVWEIEAPTELRISRVMKRNSTSREEVIQRINSQKLPDNIAIHPQTIHIVNDEIAPILPQITNLL